MMPFHGSSVGSALLPIEWLLGFLNRGKFGNRLDAIMRELLVDRHGGGID
jgi:hypothetical protein